MTRATIVAEMAAQKTKTNPLGAGRPPRAGKPTTQRLSMRLTDDELDAYTAAAAEAGIAVVEWIRRACAAALPRKRSGR